MLIAEQPRITTALDKLRVFSDTSTRLVNDSQADLVTNLRNLDPTIRALADVGDGLDQALAIATVFPLSQNVIDRGARGDFMNLFAVIDLTIPRLKRSFEAGYPLGSARRSPGAGARRPLLPALHLRPADDADHAGTCCPGLTGRCAAHSRRCFATA